MRSPSYLRHDVHFWNWHFSISSLIKRFPARWVCLPVRLNHTYGGRCENWRLRLFPRELRRNRLRYTNDEEGALMAMWCPSHIVYAFVPFALPEQSQA